MADNEGLLGFLPPISRTTLQKFLEQHSSGVCFLNDQGAILFANQKLAEILGLPMAAIVDSVLDDFFSPESSEDELAHIKKLVTSGEEQIAGDNFVIHAIKGDGSSVPLQLSCNLIRENGQKLIFCTIDDISAQAALQKQLYHQTITDSLTGIFNRRHFDEQLMQEFKRATRYRRPFSVIIIDIDGFKQANDLFGHAFGDEMLIKATESFQRVLRQGDSVYRYGGDEFAMILPETAKEGAIEVTGRLKENFSKNCINREKRLKLSLSIGIASYPEDGSDEKGLIGSADRRMYLSKESGGNMITAHDAINYLSNDTEALLRSLGTLAHLLERSRGLSSNGLNHSQVIRSLAIEIGQKLGLPQERLILLEQASTLHDIGTINIPTSTLKKEGLLSENEWNEIKRHTLIGEEIIGMIAQAEQKELAELGQIIGQHHERLDGSGYPRGLKGDEIVLEARILAVTDAYNAMTSARPYRQAFTRFEALEEIKRVAGQHYDAAVVEKLIQLESLH